MKVYRFVHAPTGDFWSTRRGKGFWTDKGKALKAFKTPNSHWGRVTKERLDEYWLMEYDLLLSQKWFMDEVNSK